VGVLVLCLLSHCWARRFTRTPLSSGLDSLNNGVWKMLSSFLQLIKRFWLLGGISLLSVFITYYIVVNFLFPAFVSNVCSGEPECKWSLLEGYASLLTLAILIGGIVFAAREYTRQESQLSFQIYEAIHAKMTDPREEAARRWIILNIDPINGDVSEDEWYESVTQKIHEKPNDWMGDMSPGHQNVKIALNMLDYVGFIAENYMNVVGPLLEWMSSPIAKVWERLGPYLEKQRTERGEPDYYRSAFYIGEKCMNWRKEKRYKSKIIDSGI
jgi:hypothetical protein